MLRTFFFFFSFFFFFFFSFFAFMASWIAHSCCACSVSPATFRPSPPFCLSSVFWLFSCPEPPRTSLIHGDSWNLLDWNILECWSLLLTCLYKQGRHAKSVGLPTHAEDFSKLSLAVSFFFFLSFSDSELSSLSCYLQSSSRVTSSQARSTSPIFHLDDSCCYKKLHNHWQVKGGPHPSILNLI